jgi:hypothetical protein
VRGPARCSSQSASSRTAWLSSRRSAPSEICLQSAFW